MMTAAAVVSSLLVAQAQPPAPPVELRVAAVQMRSTFDVAENTAYVVKRLEELASQGVQVAVFPECALTGYTKEKSFTVDAKAIEKAERDIASVCARRKIAAVVGTVHKSAAGKLYNAALVVNSKGEVVERYGKLQLAGEEWATPGNHMALFDLEGVPSTVIVCHDERYPEFVRIPALAGARVIYYISHESGMKEEHKLPGYRAQMMARAVENQMFAVAANAPGDMRDNSGSHGQSRIVNEDGNIQSEASIYADEVVIGTLRIRPGGRLTRPLEGVTGAWWKQGLEQLLRDRHRKLGE